MSNLKYNRNEHIYETDTDVENRHMDTKGGKLWWGGDGGVLNWAIGIDMYTLMYIKLMTNKNLQYKKTKQLILKFHWVICMEIC